MVQLCQELLPYVMVPVLRGSALKRKLPIFMELLKAFEEFSTEYPGKYFLRAEEVFITETFEADGILKPSACNKHMDMRMKIHLLAPSMKDRNDAGSTAHVFVPAGSFPYRL